MSAWEASLDDDACYYPPHGTAQEPHRDPCGCLGCLPAQRSGDTAQFETRFNMLQRSLADLSAMVEQLKASDQQLQQQLDKMRTNYDQRLERLEKGAAPKPVPSRGTKH